jgi:hypothetical protein
MEKKKPKGIDFKRTMFHILMKGKVVVSVGYFTVGDTIRSGLCYLDVSFENDEPEVSINYNFGKKKIVLEP